MKQKLVIKIAAHDQKSRTRALKTAVGFSGVESANIKEGQIEVVGDGVDSVELTKALRKSFGKRDCCMRKTMGFAELVNVSAVPPSKPKNPDSRPPHVVCQFGRPQPFILVEDYHPCNDFRNPSFCSIM